jgi:flavin reductase (DIM6/NTAB) family NADH-FMN oxidoreductase RutF
MLLKATDLNARARHQLLTSLVVPRPIAWISTRAPDGRRNLAPFSFYMGVSSTPLLVAVSIGERRGTAKDTLANIRDTGVFCINVVSEVHLQEMNESSGEYGPEVDEFERAGVGAGEATTVDCPLVDDAPAVLECRLFEVVDLEGSANTLILGEILAVRLGKGVEPSEGGFAVPPQSLSPVGRMGGDLYTLFRESVSLSRPEAG